MRITSTLLILSFYVVGNAQTDAFPVPRNTCIPINSQKQNTSQDSQFRTTCMSTKTKGSAPLLVIDGVLCNQAQLEDLNPADIISIEVLKNPSSATIYCNRNLEGVILITTKAFVSKKIIIKDNTDSSIIPGASISFIERNNTIKGLADNSGVFTTDKLKKGLQYEMMISSVGYKPFKASFTNSSSGEQQIFLERNIETGPEIVIRSERNRRRGCPNGGYIKKVAGPEIIKQEKKVEMTEVLAKSIYPNPVQRNGAFNVEFKTEKNEALQLSVLGLDGKMVMMQSQKVIKGLNRISIIADARWAAGVYMVWMKDEKGNVVKQDKLIVQ